MSLDDDMVSVGVRRQSRSPPTLRCHFLVNVGARRQSRSPPCYGFFGVGFAGNAAAPQHRSFVVGSEKEFAGESLSFPYSVRFLMAANHWDHKL